MRCCLLEYVTVAREQCRLWSLVPCDWRRYGAGSRAWGFATLVGVSRLECEWCGTVGRVWRGVFRWRGCGTGSLRLLYVARSLLSQLPWEFYTISDGKFIEERMLTEGLTLGLANVHN